MPGPELCPNRVSGTIGEIPFGIGEARILTRQLVYGGWYRLFRLTIEMPDGALAERHLLDNGSAVAVLPYDLARGVVMLIKQPRAAVLDAGEEAIFEAIAGSLEGASPEDRIRDEALEEGGLRLGELIPVANVWALPPVSAERVQLYLAHYGREDMVSAGGGVPGEGEHITVFEVGLDALRVMVAEGMLTDAKTLILAQALLLRLAYEPVAERTPVSAPARNGNIQ